MSNISILVGHVPLPGPPCSAAHNARRKQGTRQKVWKKIATKKVRKYERNVGRELVKKLRKKKARN